MIGSPLFYIMIKYNKNKLVNSLKSNSRIYLGFSFKINSKVQNKNFSKSHNIKAIILLIF